jgi:ADP-heptose:LPS heptosyltransferase
MSAIKSREIISALTFPVILLGDKTDLEKGNFIADKLTNVYNACGKFSIRKSAGLMYCSKLVIAHDSGLMHIAAALQKPVISIWGCTTPSLGMAPYLPNNRSVIIEPLGREKRPCSKLGNRCKYSENCIETVENSSIVASINELIDQII